jgi:ferritin-like protein
LPAPEEDAPHRTRIESREDLSFILSEASTLEHMIMCEYLFAVFSLKRTESEGITSAELERVQAWKGVIETVAIQEMTHLALVNNMLVSIGSSPYFQHSNFPQPSRYFSPNIRLALVPFGEQALRHFLYLERPEGMSIEGVPGFEVLGDLNPPELQGGIVPKQQYFSTVGNLYRGIQKGFADLTEKYGEDGVFIGAAHTQATEERFGLPSLITVKDLDSANRAVEGIVEMGEGARGDWSNAHFGMFLGIFNELMQARKTNPEFRPTRPVVAAYTRPPIGVENTTIIADHFTASVADLFNASYGLAVQTLSRFYIHDSDKPDELQALADAAVGIMSRALDPIGVLLTALPVGGNLSGVTAGPSFELQNREYVLPHRREAIMVIEERLAELAGHASTLAKSSPSPASAKQLKSIEDSFLDLARILAGSFGGL